MILIKLLYAVQFPQDKENSYYVRFSNTGFAFTLDLCLFVKPLFITELKIELLFTQLKLECPKVKSIFLFKMYCIYFDCIIYK